MLDPTEKQIEFLKKLGQDVDHLPVDFDRMAASKLIDKLVKERGAGPTEKQIAALQKFKYFDVPATRADASEILQDLINDAKEFMLRKQRIFQEMESSTGFQDASGLTSNTKARC